MYSPNKVCEPARERSLHAPSIFVAWDTLFVLTQVRWYGGGTEENLRHGYEPCATRVGQKELHERSLYYEKASVSHDSSIL